MEWQLVIEICGVIGGVATFLALLLGPMFYLGSKIDSIRKDLQDEMKEFKEEQKEFRSEAKNFHSRLLILEERYLKLREEK